VNLERRVPQAVADALSAMGHGIQMRGEWSNASAPALIVFREGVLDAGADPRRGRFAFGR
jgi:gamma-glutamyltranspeptidase